VTGHPDDVADVLTRAAHKLDVYPCDMPAAVAVPLAALLRAEAAGHKAVHGIPDLLDAVAGQSLGVEMRASYSTVPELLSVARAILCETEPRDA
jgi:hypothetical protein